MADLSAEQFEQLPDFVKGDYEQSGEVYRPRAEGKVAALKSSLDDLGGKYKTTESQLKEILGKQEEDRTKAEEAALERLKKEGKTDEIVQDLERRHGETMKEFQDRYDKLASASKREKSELVLNDISSELGIIDKSKGMFKKLLRDRIDIDPETGKTTYLDEDGGATSLDKAGFIAELAKDESLNPIRKTEVNSGGQANGSTSKSGGATKEDNTASKAKENGDLGGFLKASLIR